MQKARSGITIPQKGKKINMRINAIVFIYLVSVICEQ